MSGNAIDRVLERVRQSQARLALQLVADRRTRSAAQPAVGEPHATGARVFDPLTGQEGEVIGGGNQDIVVPTAQR